MNRRLLRYLNIFCFVIKLFTWSSIKYVGIRAVICVISGFHHEVDENCAFLSYYTASNGNFLPTFRDNLSVQS